ncbi:hypothetical protein [Vibrio sp. PNB22_4_2]
MNGKVLTPIFFISLIILFYKRNSLEFCLSFAIFFSIFVTAGYVISVGSIEVSYAQFSLLITIFLFFITKVIYGDFSRWHFIKILLFFTSLIASYIYVSVIDVSHVLVYATGMDYADGVLSNPRVGPHNIKEFLNVVMFSLFSMLLVISDRNVIIDNILDWGRWVIVLIVIEFCTKNIFNSSIFLDYVNFLFGEGKYQIDFLFERAGFFSLQGLTREPNQLVRGLFIWLVVALFKNDKKYYPFILIGVCALAVSGSFAGASLILFVILITIVIYGNIKYLSVVPILILFIYIVLESVDYTYYLERLSNISSDLRVVSILKSIEVFKHVPLFGVGFGNSMSFGTFPVIISNMGIVGTISWLMVCLHGNRMNYKGALVLILFLSSLLVNGGKGTVYATSTLFIFMAISELSNKKS